MEGHIKVTVVSRSRYDGGEEELTFTGKGLLKMTEQGFHLRYTADDGSGVKTASDVMAENGTVRLRIVGENGYTLWLDPTRPTDNPIPTEAGRLSIRAVTNRLDWRLDAEQGELLMDYTLLAQGITLSDMCVSIQMRNE